MAQAEAQILDRLETARREDTWKKNPRMRKSVSTSTPNVQEIDPPRDWLDDPLVALSRPLGPYTYEKAEFYLDTEPVELYNGWLVIDETPDFNEKVLEGDLYAHLSGANLLSKFGHLLTDQTECHLRDGNVIKPDLCLISRRRVKEWVRARGPRNRSCLMGSPELIIEVRSSSDSQPKDQMKRTCYFDNGAEIIWDIDQRKQIIYVYTMDSQDEPATYKVGDEIDCEPLLPGWRRELADLFDTDISIEVMFSEVVEASREEGRRESEQRGMLAAKQDTLLQILVLKFGDLSDEITELIQATEDMGQLNQWVNETMQADSLDALFDQRDGT